MFQNLNRFPLSDGEILDRPDLFRESLAGQTEQPAYAPYMDSRLYRADAHWDRDHQLTEGNVMLEQTERDYVGQYQTDYGNLTRSVILRWLFMLVEAPVTVKARSNHCEFILTN